MSTLHLSKADKIAFATAIAKKHAKESSEANASKIGTRLLRKFEKRIAAVPCGECKATLRKLNSMTPDAVELSRNEIVKEIYENSQKAGAAWWAKASMAVDKMLTNGVTMKHIIGLWLDESVKEERDAISKAAT
jgi:hypothetical protein